jgi:hypothetical protein
MNKDQRDVSHIDKGEINEPVAWMHTNSKQIFKTKKPNEFDLHLFTPLYTHPMRNDEDDDIFRKEQVEKFYAEARPLREKYKPRELTDEEIEKTWHELYPLDSNSYWEDNRKGFCQRRFARAILKKASE